MKLKPYSCLSDKTTADLFSKLCFYIKEAILNSFKVIENVNED